VHQIDFRLPLDYARGTFAEPFGFAQDKLRRSERDTCAPG
jgi:hypothetical protein